MMVDTKQVPMLSPKLTSGFSMPVEDLFSPYDTKEFPTSLDELLKMGDLDVFVPVIQVSQYEMSGDSSNSASDSDEDC